MARREAASDLGAHGDDALSSSGREWRRDRCWTLLVVGVGVVEESVDDDFEGAGPEVWAYVLGVFADGRSIWMIMGMSGVAKSARSRPVALARSTTPPDQWSQPAVDALLPVPASWLGR
jgi:hypothetical protein